MADPALQRRLALLQDSGQLDDDIGALLFSWLARAAASVGVEATETNFANLVTHTALALQRARHGEAIEDWAVNHADELAGVPAVVDIADHLVTRARNELQIDLPPNERDFVALHLAAAALKAEGG